MNTIIRLMSWIDKILIRRFGTSLINRLITRRLGLPPVPTLLLTTTGRRSGKLIEIPIFYFERNQSYYVIASKGGAAQHPAWFFNLEAKPEAWVNFAGRKRKVRARVAEGDERKEVWSVAAVAYPPYNEYQARATARLIPVVALDPVRD
jgi:proline iminopeptidase